MKTKKTTPLDRDPPLLVNRPLIRLEQQDPPLDLKKAPLLVQLKGSYSAWAAFESYIRGEIDRKVQCMNTHN